MKSKAGCPVLENPADEYIDYLQGQPFVIGLIYLVAGPIIGIGGTVFFPWIMAGLVMLGVSAILGSILLAFGAMSTTLGFWISLVVSLLVGAGLGFLVFKKKWMMVGSLGAIGGFFGGTILNSLVIQFGYSAAWTYYFIGVTCAIIGFVVACKMGKAIVLVGTSLSGAYLFMRSWTYMFPETWPDVDDALE